MALVRPHPRLRRSGTSARPTARRSARCSASLRREWAQPGSEQCAEDARGLAEQPPQLREEPLPAGCVPTRVGERPEGVRDDDERGEEPASAGRTSGDPEPRWGFGLIGPGANKSLLDCASISRSSRTARSASEAPDSAIDFLRSSRSFRRRTCRPRMPPLARKPNVAPRAPATAATTRISTSTRGP